MCTKSVQNATNEGNDVKNKNIFTNLVDNQQKI